MPSAPCSAQTSAMADNGRRRLRRLLPVSAALLALVVAGPLLAVAVGVARLDGDWRTGSRASAGIAPAPAAHQDAVVQVYAARALGWRGAFGVHTWIAMKDRGAERYRRLEVIGWRHYHGLPALTVNHRPPDGRWYGAMPALLADLRGAAAEAAIRSIELAAELYPLADHYRVWPGPNSNTFTAFIGRSVPTLALHLPATAIGKDYIPGGVFARAPSATGYQFNVLGLVGGTAARVEGVELNFLGQSVGLDPAPLTLKMPGLGNIRLFEGG